MRKISFFDFILLFSAGISLGWMTGMTVEKVVAGIIATLLTAVVTIITYFSGIKDAPEQSFFYGKVDVRPVSLLIIGLGVGSGLGVWTRTHNYLGIDSQGENRIGMLGLKKQEADSIKAVYGGYVNDTVIYKRLFDLDFPQTDQDNRGVIVSETQDKNTLRSSAFKDSGRPILFDKEVKIETCKLLCNADSPDKKRGTLKLIEPSMYKQLDIDKKRIETNLSKKCGCKIEF